MPFSKAYCFYSGQKIMPDSASQGKLREIGPKPFSLETLLTFWVLAIMLPAAAIFCLLNYADFSKAEARNMQIIDTMLATYDQIQKACNPVEFFEAQIKQAEAAVGLPERNSNFRLDQHNLQAIPESLHHMFCSRKSFDLLLLITSEKDLGSTRVFTDPVKAPDYAKPGLRAARELQKEYRSQYIQGLPEKRNAASKKILQSFLTSIFGTYLDPVHADEDFALGFSDKRGINRFLTSRRLICAPDGSPIFSYIALFRESDNSLAQSFAVASSELASTGFSFRLKMSQARPFPFVFAERDGRLTLNGPVNFNCLISGNMQERDIATSLINRGIMAHTPAIYPHIEITAGKLLVNKDIDAVKPGFVIFIFLCFSLLMLKSFHQQGNLKVSIRARLFISVLLAMALPAAMFIFYSHRHLKRNFSQRQNQMGEYLKNHLKQLGFSVKSADQAQTEKLLHFVDHMRQIVFDEKAPELQNLLEDSLGKTVQGASLIRSDGLIIEQMAYDLNAEGKMESNINFVRDFTYAMAIKIFKLMGLNFGGFQKQLQSTSRGKKLLGIAEMVSVIDVNNFCNYEGNAQVSKQDFGNFRLQNYKFLPPASGGEKHGAILMLLQDIREIAHIIIDEFAGKWTFFRHDSSEGFVETSIISCYNSACSSPDFGKVWPPQKKLTSLEMGVIHKLTQGLNEAEMQIIGEDGVPILLSGRKISGYPLIALAQCRMETLARQKSQTIAIIGGNFLYVLMLLIILVSILSALFTPPIDRLLDAATLTGEGNLVEISNDFNNELSLLTNEFNTMNSQIKERERLERFISAGATQAIVSESLGLKEMQSQRVNCTIVFIHIKDFGRLNTSLSPEELFQLLNLYFPFAEDFIVAEGGQIDKYIGDAIMAVFASDTGLDILAAERACKSVRKIQMQLSALNQVLLENNLPKIEIGIGVSSGEVISGRIGSTHGRLDYTVIGDRVNLAARLEAASHSMVGNHILIDEATWASVKEHLACCFHGEIKIKGKAQPVKTYEIIA